MSLQLGTLRMAIVGLLTIAAGTALAADARLSQADRDFMIKAAQGGLMEVAAGKLAMTRAQDPAVKAFGRTMVADHTGANATLKSLADSKQLTLPDQVGPEEQASLGKLEGLNGAEFDHTYADMMVKDHVGDIKEFQNEAKSGQDPAVKDFAAQTLPTLKHHLTMANHLAEQQKKGK